MANGLVRDNGRMWNSLNSNRTGLQGFIAIAEDGLNSSSELFKPLGRVHLWITICLFSLACLVQTVSAASQTVAIYTVDIDVESDSVPEREKAAREALQLVYGRATGSPEPLVHYPRLKFYLAKATRYLSSYAYRSEVRILEADFSPEGGSEENWLQEVDSLESLLEQEPEHGNKSATQKTQQLVLQLQFEPATIKKHLRESQAPHWPARRPQLETVFIGNDEQGELDIAASGSRLPEVLPAIKYHAEKLGLSTSLRLAKKLDANDIWYTSINALPAKVEQNSAALFAKIEPVAKIEPMPGTAAEVPENSGWAARWIFIWGDILYTEQTSADEQWQLIGQGMEIAQQQFAARLANRLGGGGQGAGSTRIVLIEGVDSTERYFALIDHLDSLEVTRGYVITQAADDLLSIQFKTQASPASLRRLLTLERRLVSLDQEAYRFRWQ